MAIKKAVIQLVVLFDDKEVDSSPLEDGSLTDIERNMNYGAMLGQSTLMSIEVVPAARLKEEQLALGNDGTFFPVEDDAGPQP